MDSPFLTLPPELIEKIALWLPTTIDVLNLASTNRHFHATLTTGVLYKTHMMEEGWDVEHWEEEDKEDHDSDRESNVDDALGNTLIPPPDRRVRVWQHANHLHRRAQALLDASTSNDGRYFLYPEPYDGDNTWYPSLCFSTWGTSLFDAGEDSQPMGAQWETEPGLIDGLKASLWVCGIGPSLVRIVTYHDALNHPRLLDPKYYDTWRTTLRVFIAMALHKHLPSISSGTTTQGPQTLAVLANRSAEFEQAAVGYFYLLFQRDLPALTTLMDDLKLKILPALATRHRSRSAMTFQQQIFRLVPDHADRFSDRLSESRRFTVCFVAMLCMYLTLTLNPQTSDTIPPPNRVVDSGTLRAWVRATYGGVTSSLSELPSHEIEHTPLASMLENTGYEWAGYYYHLSANWTSHDPPMTIILRRHPPAPEYPDDIVLSGDGNDSIGPFLLSGRCNRRTGLLVMSKTYVGRHMWTWDGVVTPFGLVGRWGNNSGGLWWIWPREWSDV